MKRSAFCALLLLLGLLIGCRQSGFTLEEEQKWKAVDASLCQNEQVRLLKEKGYLTEFLAILEGEYEAQKIEYIEDQRKQIEAWGLTLESTMNQLKEKAQNYLDKTHHGVQIDDEAYETLRHFYLEDDTSHAEKKAKEDLAFGSFYLYLCIREQSPDWAEDTTLRKISEHDFKANFNSQKLLADFLLAKGLTDGNVTTQKTTIRQTK